MVGVFVVIALVKWLDPNRFSLFLSGIFSETYNSRYAQREFGLLSRFNTLMSIVAYTIFTVLFIQIINKQPDANMYLSGYGLLLLVFFAVLLFFSLQSLLLLMLGVLFNNKAIITEFFFNKVYARNYSALIILPFLLLAVYGFFGQGIFLSIAFYVFVVAYVLGLLRALYITLTKYTAKRYYIILYLCALEIAPVMFIVKVLF